MATPLGDGVEATQFFGEMIRAAAADMPERWNMAVHDEVGRTLATVSPQMKVGMSG